MATRTQTKPLEKRETSNLIGSDKVEGTPVYRSNGDSVGQIERVMIDKLSGKVAYAVMSFGGFLGIGEDYYPLRLSVTRSTSQNNSSKMLRDTPGTITGIGLTAHEWKTSATTTDFDRDVKKRRRS